MRKIMNLKLRRCFQNYKYSPIEDIIDFKCGRLENVFIALWFREIDYVKT